MNRRIAPILAAFGTGIVLLALVSVGVYLVFVRGTTKPTTSQTQNVSLSDDSAVQQPGETHIIGGELGVTGTVNTSSLQVTGGSSLQDLSVAGQLKTSSLNLTSSNNQSTAGTLYIASDGSLNYTAAGATLNISQAASRPIPTVAPSVLSLQGQTGNISLAAGNGVAIDGTTISNTGVTSFGGQKGAIAIGSGLSLNGNMLSSTGIQSISSLSANLILATDSNGNLTIEDAGTGSGGTVSLAPATPQTDASSFASIAVNKTGTGDLIQLSTGVSPVNRFVVDTTGAITSGSISFGQITGVPTFVSSVGGANGALALGSGLARSGQTISSTGVLSLGGTSGAITLGNGLTLTGGQLSATGSGITSVTGTPNQVIVSGTGNLTLSLPQSIATSSTPTFAGLTLTGGIAGVTGTFSGTVSGASAATNTQFTTLGQVNSLIAASGAGGGVNSLNNETGALSIQGNGQIAVDASTSPSIKLSIQGNSIGNAQLAYATGQNLTTTSTPAFAGLTVSGSGSFVGTVSGAAAVNGGDFVTKNQLNTAVGSVGGGSVVGGSGTVDKIAMFTGATTVGDSILVQSDANSDGTPDTITVVGTLAATALQGDGSGLTNVDAATLGSHPASYFTNASNLASGTVPSARVAGGYTGITGLGTITSGAWNADPLTDAYVSDTLTIGSGGSVDWSALNNYPVACSAGQAITALGDTLTCQTFLTSSSADGSYVQLQPTTSGAAQTGNLKVTGAAIAGSIQGVTGSFSGTVSGADATANNQFATLGQVNSLISASGTGVNSLNGQTGAITLQGNSQIAVDATTSPYINLSIQGNSIGDAQLAYKTGQNLATVSTPSFASLTLTGNLVAVSGSFSGTVSGASATANNQFVTLAQLNTAVGGVGTGVTTVGTLDSGTASVNGASINGSTIYLQSASATMPGLVTTSAQTFAGNKTFNGNLALGAGQSFTITGGATGTRPASPTKGQIYYDTTTNTLLSWNGTKWMSDQNTANKVIAMGSATGCTGTSPVASSNPDGADYVVTSCTSAQTVINAAIAALPASGGTVYLEDGTYIIDGQINMASNVTLSGDGLSTIIKVKDATSADGLVANNVSRATIQNLKVDGNKANNAGGFNNGIMLMSVGSGSGATAVPGILINGVEVTNFPQQGLYGLSGANSKITNSNFSQNGKNGISMWLNSTTFDGIHAQGNGQAGFYGSSTGLSITNSVFDGNTKEGASMGSGHNFTFTGNTVENNGTTGVYVSATPGTISNNTVFSNAGAGIGLYGSSITVSGNSVYSNTSYGIYGQIATYSLVTGNTVYLNGSDGIHFWNSNNNSQITNNVIENNGGSGSAYGITTVLSNNIYMANNTITDTAGTGTAIYIDDTSDILSGNIYSGTGAASINDNGTATIWSNQADANGNIINKGIGALTVGTSTVSGTFSLQGGLTSVALPTPSTPTMSKTGTAGTTSYSYVVTALDGTGETLPSTAATLTTGNATLSSTNYNTITWKEVSGAVQYKIYRTASGGTPVTTGLIGTVSAVAQATQAFNDTGLSASGSVPAANTTGGATMAGLLQGAKGVNAPALDSISGALTIGAANASSISIGKTTSNVATTLNGTVLIKPTTGNDSSTALQVQYANGTSLLNVDTNRGTVTIQGSNPYSANLVIKAAATQGADNMIMFQDASGNEMADLGADGRGNLAFGLGATGFYTQPSGGGNIGIGTYAVGGVTSGYNNIGIGNSASNRVQDGAYNVAVGGTSLNANISGSNNTAVGDGALTSTTAGGNTGIGSSALTSTTTGGQNVAVGLYAGYRNTTGYNNTFLGTGAGNCHWSVQFCTSPNLQGSTAVGYEAQVQANNSLVLGSVDDQVNVGIGTTVPLNILSVSPVDYSTGTASQSGNTITGTGTTWTASMVGDELVFSDGTHGVVTGFTDATHLTLGTSQTVADQAYRLHRAGLNVTSSGNVGIGTTNPATNQLSVAGTTLFQTTSLTALQIQNSAGAALFTADTTNMTVTIAKLVTGDITVNGHVVTGGTTPTIAAGAAACTTPTVSIVGNDTAGTITVTTGTGCTSAGTLATITFNKSFGAAPRIMLTPKTAASAVLGSFNGTSATTSFTLDTSSTAASATTYTFNYLAIQ